MSTWTLPQGSSKHDPGEGSSKQDPGEGSSRQDPGEGSSRQYPAQGSSIHNPTQRPSAQELALGSLQNPIDLDEQVERLTRLRDGISRVALDPNPDDDNEAITEEFERALESLDLSEVNNVVDLTEDDEAELSGPQGVFMPMRNPRLTRSQTLQHSVTVGGEQLDEGMLVELHEPIGRYQSDFVLVKYIVADYSPDGGIIEALIRGYPFTSNTKMKGLLPMHIGELTQIVEIEDYDKRPDLEQALVEVTRDQIKCKRNLRMTNAPYPEHIDIVGKYESEEDMVAHGWLVCRWTYRIVYSTRRHFRLNSPHEWALMRTPKLMCTEKRYHAKGSELLKKWREGKVRFGSYIPEQGGLPQPIPANARTRVFGQQYTAADIFCCAGGATRGMEDAGLKVVAAIDHCKNACASYRANFPDVELHHMEIFDYVNSIGDDQTQYVDIVHMSPPCQFFSPAHTRTGRNDEANSAVLFCCKSVLEKLRPRIFTLEQTFGILMPKFQGYLNTMIQGFAELGYSINWKVVELSHWGVPQSRKRMIMVGACPGEPLPPMSGKVYGSGRPGRPPYRCVEDAIADIPRRGDPLHDVAAATREFRGGRAYSRHMVLPRTVTCTGLVMCHPSAKRNFTLRELAALQGFPHFHKFLAPGVRKQIGNAFPPNAVKTLAGCVRRALVKTDRSTVEEAELSDGDDAGWV